MPPPPPPKKKKAFRKINQEYQAMCESIEYQNKKCKLSKIPPCDILEQLWSSRGNTFSGKGCGPIPSDIAKYRRLKSTYMVQCGKDAFI